MMRFTFRLFALPLALFYSQRRYAFSILLFTETMQPSGFFLNPALMYVDYVRWYRQ